MFRLFSRWQIERSAHNIKHSGLTQTTCNCGGQHLAAVVKLPIFDLYRCNGTHCFCKYNY